MKHSINYNLNKPDYADQYDLRHWNENTDVIDEVLKEHSDSIDNESTSRQQGDEELDRKINSLLGLDGSAVNKAINDKNGNDIVETYQTKANKVNSWQETPSDIKYPSEKLVKDTIDAEINDRQTADITLTNLINEEKQARIQAINDEATARDEAISAGNTKQINEIRINGVALEKTNNMSEIKTSFKISDGTNEGVVVNMSNGVVTIMLPSAIKGAVFN